MVQQQRFHFPTGLNYAAVKTIAHLVFKSSQKPSLKLLETMIHIPFVPHHWKFDVTTQTRADLKIADHTAVLLVHCSHFSAPPLKSKVRLLKVLAVLFPWSSVQCHVSCEVWNPLHCAGLQQM